jgi:hypothetical protein
VELPGGFLVANLRSQAAAHDDLRLRPGRYFKFYGQVGALSDSVSNFTHPRSKQERRNAARLK